MNESYKAAGVDVEAGYKSVELMREHVKKTFTAGVVSDIGGFGGLFELGKMGEFKEPILVSGTDGVGTKLKLAFIMDKHDSVGMDCVAMCVNDIICSGARPLFFLDYIAVGKNFPEKVADIVKGVADGCLQSGCALIGGETAEMPGFYPIDEYDLAGFSVGVAEKSKMIDIKNVKEGDVLIGLASSGPHSNGYSLIRKVFGEDKAKLNEFIPSLGKTLGEALLTPTRIYVKAILSVLEKFKVNGISHVTGGGFYENIPRMLDGKGAKIDKNAWEIPEIFSLLQNEGKIDEKGMFNTFNMGIGMVLAVDSEIANELMEFLKSIDEKAYKIGYVTKEAGIVI